MVCLPVVGWNRSNQASIVAQYWNDSLWAHGASLGMILHVRHGNPQTLVVCSELQQERMPSCCGCFYAGEAKEGSAG